METLFDEVKNNIKVFRLHSSSTDLLDVFYYTYAVWAWKKHVLCSITSILFGYNRMKVDSDGTVSNLKCVLFPLIPLM